MKFSRRTFVVLSIFVTVSLLLAACQLAREIPPASEKPAPTKSAAKVKDFVLYNVTTGHIKPSKLVPVPAVPALTDPGQLPSADVESNIPSLILIEQAGKEIQFAFGWKSKTWRFHGLCKNNWARLELVVGGSSSLSGEKVWVLPVPAQFEIWLINVNDSYLQYHNKGPRLNLACSQNTWTY